MAATHSAFHTEKPLRASDRGQQQGKTLASMPFLLALQGNQLAMIMD